MLRTSEAAVSPNEGWLSGRPRTGRQHLSGGQRRSARRHPVGRGGGPDLQLDINVCRATQETEASTPGSVCFKTDLEEEQISLLIDKTWAPTRDNLSAVGSLPRQTVVPVQSNCRVLP